MPRNTIFLILAVLFSMLLLWNFTSGPESEEAPVATGETTEADLPAVPTRITPSVLQQAARAQKQQDLAELQQRLNEELKKREARVQVLTELKRRQQETPNSSIYSSRINSYDTEIQNLLDILSNYRDAEEDLNHSASEALRNQDSAARLARDQLDLQIQKVEQNIRNIQIDLRYLQDFSVGKDANQVLRQSDHLQIQLADLENQLDALRAQRVDVSARILNNTGAIQSLAEQARNELRNSAAAAQEQIFSLRSEIDRLQGVRYQSQSSLSVLRSQISQAEKDFEIQDQEVKSLQQQILNKQSEIGQQQ